MKSHTTHFDDCGCLSNRNFKLIKQMREEIDRLKTELEVNYIIKTECQKSLAICQDENEEQSKDFIKEVNGLQLKINYLKSSLVEAVEVIKKYQQHFHAPNKDCSCVIAVNSFISKQEKGEIK